VLPRELFFQVFLGVLSRVSIKRVFFLSSASHEGVPAKVGSLDSQASPSVVIADSLFILCCGFVVATNIKRRVKGKITTEGLGRTERFLSRSHFVSWT